jgi:hypothetical protein
LPPDEPESPEASTAPKEAATLEPELAAAETPTPEPAAVEIPTAEMVDVEAETPILPLPAKVEES